MVKYSTYYQIPLGILKIEANEWALLSVVFTSGEAQIKASEPGQSHIVEDTVMQLREYFTGTRKFFNLPLAPEGSEFQQRVWKELTAIPYGQAITYTQLAKRLGSLKLIRAAGSANGKNPIGIIIPCHRVIGNNGELVGYAGGLWRKQWLLEHEGSKQLLPFK